MRSPKNIITIIFLIGAIALMLKLGFWQVQRLEWKNNIIAQIQATESIDVTQIPLNLDTAKDYDRGYLKGQYLQHPPIQIQPRTNDKGDVGYHLIFPFKTNNGQIILVNWGWHQGATFPIPSKDSMIIAGYLKSPTKPNAFSPKNRPSQSRWYRTDIRQIEQTYNIQNIYPMILVMANRDNNDDNTHKGHAPYPRNNHMQYAIFWFAMSGLLFVLSLIYIMRKNKTKTA